MQSQKERYYENHEGGPNPRPHANLAHAVTTELYGRMVKCG